MYHEVTYEKQASRMRSRIAVAVICVLLCAVIAWAFVTSASVSRRQSVASVRDAILTAAVQCAAIEGSYPSSLAHLESHYGLVINHNDYIIYYEWLADNVPPTVTVMVR